MKLIASLSCLALASSLAAQDRTIRMPRYPQISPDGAHVAFAWRDDVWIAPSSGGDARRLTTHPGEDSRPVFSPDGTTIAFTSDRGGSTQIYTVPTSGGSPTQVTHDSHSKRLLGYANADELLVRMTTDRGFHYSESGRAFVIDVRGKKPKRMLFDAGIADAAIAKSGSKVLFTRGRSSWSRKGYQGAQAAQMWIWDEQQGFQRHTGDRPAFQNVAEMNPMWAPDALGYYFVSDPDGTFDVYYRSFRDHQPKRITNVGKADRSDDGVAFASLSADGKKLLYRRRFDLQLLDIESGVTTDVALRATGDASTHSLERRTESGASAIAFTEDGKQMAFVAGEDVYVMDRILKEPVRVTNTPHRETSVAFSADGKRLFFVSDAGGEVDIWQATHEQEDNVWWLAKEFQLQQVTNDRAVESRLTLSPAGKHIAYLKGTDLFVMDTDGTDHRRVVEAWSQPSFDWSPDGKWFVYATQDSDYNSDVWITPLDGTREPFNVSRHPDRDGNPVWSGDGKRIAFVSRRQGDESDIYYLNLQKGDEEKTARDKKLEEAIAAMKKKGPSRGNGSRADPSARSGDGGRRRRGGRGRPGSAPTADPKATATDANAKKASDDDKKKKNAPVEVKIDFDGLLDRMHRISNPDSTESGLIWSPDGKKLAFSASVGGERGFYTVEFPDVGKPKKLASSGLRSARWLRQTKEIVGTGSSSGSSTSSRGRRSFGRSGGGTPAAMDARGSTKTFAFSVRRTRDWSAIRQVSFDQAWRAMRDRFYDEKLNNRDWDAIRAKYRPVAAACLGADEFSELMNMMLGELNASHMGHRGGSDPLPNVEDQNNWSATTYHLGLRYVLPREDSGITVESVIPGSPCHQARSRVHEGETLLAIDGTPITRDFDLDAALTMDTLRDVELTVTDREGNERKVTVRPTRSVSGLLYDEWVENNRSKVDEWSEGKLGYLHIRGMDMRSFRQMETDLYDAGAGKDGLIVDVRFNGGGSTTDHVLTALTQPRHAITKSRGSGEGYPQDRKVYASWTKPIVLMCNEHSFSNAEILSHAVKQLGRGRLVGMRTAGGVISTGSARLLDGSSVRMPTRGWYLVSTGEDMELNGCAPDLALWNPPDGEDKQLDSAVRTLTSDVAQAQKRGNVRIEPAAAKRARQAREAVHKR